MGKKVIDIQIFITTDVIEVQNTGIHVEGVHELSNICNKLLFNGLDTIYVHINEPIEESTLKDALMKFNIQIEKYCRADTLQVTDLSMPEIGGRFILTYTKDNKIKSGRYQISSSLY